MASTILLIYILTVLYIRYKAKEDWIDSILLGTIATAGALAFLGIAVFLGIGVYNDLAILFSK